MNTKERRDRVVNDTGRKFRNEGEGQVKKGNEAEGFVLFLVRMSHCVKCTQYWFVKNSQHWEP